MPGNDVAQHKGHMRLKEHLTCISQLRQKGPYGKGNACWQRSIISRYTGLPCIAILMPVLLQQHGSMVKASALRAGNSVAPEVRLCAVRF